MPAPSLRDALRRFASAERVPPKDCASAVGEILDGEAEAAEVAAFLTALQLRGIDVAALEGAVSAASRRMVPFEVPDGLRPVLDTCGTGGDGANSVNVSTAAAIVAAACGVRVAKHGNRSASGNSGSAEVLASLGVKFDAEPPVLLRCLEELGITFLFAPRFHPALKAVAPIRKVLPFRTVFNLTGPLVNPARPDAQVVGVPDRARADLVSSVLSRTACYTPEEVAADHDLMAWEAANSMDVFPVAREPRDYRAFVLTGEHGLDEVTLSGVTHVLAIRSERIREQTWGPEDFALPRHDDAALGVSGPDDSAGKIWEFVCGGRGPVRDVILANAAAALTLVGRAATLAEGVAIGAEAIDRGDARRLLERWARMSHS